MKMWFTEGAVTSTILIVEVIKAFSSISQCYKNTGTTFEVRIFKFIFLCGFAVNFFPHLSYGNNGILIRND